MNVRPFSGPAGDPPCEQLTRSTSVQTEQTESDIMPVENLS